MPLLFVGVTMCKFAFLGSLARYVAGEALPVQKDSFNYLAEGAQAGVRTVATALGEGLAAGAHRGGGADTLCARCQHGNDVDAKFCKNCGNPLVP
jgi:hypothetical protein